MSTDPENPSILSSVREGYFKSSPYLATRVLADLHEREQKARKLKFWKALTLSCATICIAVLGSLAWKARSSSELHATVDSPFIVRVALEEAQAAQIAEVELVLPTSLQFYSRKHPELGAKRSLRMPYRPLVSNALPFILKSNDVGTQAVRVQFFGPDRVLVAEKNLDIHVRRSL